MKQLIVIFYHQIRRELLINWRRPAAVINSLMFFAIVIILFPLAISPDNKLLHTIAPGIIWVAALLASMLSLDNLFQQDYEDGSLEQCLLSPAPLTITVVAKISAHWLLSALPLIVMTPILGLMLQLSASELGILLLSLMIGTPILSSVGAIGAAITLSLAARGVLLTILILPLCIPILILGAGSVVAAMSGVSVTSIFLLLLALLSLTIVLSPFAVVGALRGSVG